MDHHLFNSQVSRSPSCTSRVSFGKDLYIFEGRPTAVLDVDLQDKKIAALQMLWFNSECLYIGISLVIKEKRIKTHSVTHASISSTHFALRRRMGRGAFINRRFFFQRGFLFIG